MTSAVKSRSPAEDPAITATRWWSRAAPATACSSSAGSSATAGSTAGAPPDSATMALSTVELKSMICPGRAGVPGAVISSPVGMMATRGRALTRTVVWPAARIAPRS